MKTGGRKEPCVYIEPTLTIDQRGGADTRWRKLWARRGPQREVTTVSRLLGVCGRVWWHPGELMGSELKFLFELYFKI